MGDWKITVTNKTAEGGMPSKKVCIMLFQVVPHLNVDSWSSAWEVAELGYPAYVGPIDLPEKVEFYVLDKSHGNERRSGPFDVKFGETVEVSQDGKDAPPTVRVTSQEAEKGELKVINKSGNPKPLEFALYKNKKKIVSYKKVPPGEGAVLAVKPSLYIAIVEKDSIKIGTDFKAVVESEKATQFKLYPEKLEVKIGVFQKPTTEIYFQLIN